MESKEIPNIPNNWLLITVSTAGGSASLRVYVWRRLRLLGAVYLQQSVCVLPAVPAVQKEVKRFADRVQREGGTARILAFQAMDNKEYERLVGDFNAARDEEYAEVLERIPNFLDELTMERGRGRMTYAEVEENEADLERFKAWVAKIEARDYFASAKGQEVRAAIERCTEELSAFEADAIAADEDMTEEQPKADA